MIDRAPRIDPAALIDRGAPLCVELLLASTRVVGYPTVAHLDARGRLLFRAHTGARARLGPDGPNHVAGT
jgi:hypothetical protein